MYSRRCSFLQVLTYPSLRIGSGSGSLPFERLRGDMSSPPTYRLILPNLPLGLKPVLILIRTGRRFAVSDRAASWLTMGLWWDQKLAIAAANAIGTLTDSILPRRCGSCAVLLNNRERPFIRRAVIASTKCAICLHALDEWSSSFLLDGQYLLPVR
jgi:hypothetical protein